jgi:hypothetical protein
MGQTVEIKILLEKYFEGETSLWEEQQLRDYFSSQTIDAELVEYAPLFQYFKTERAEKSRPNPFRRRHIFIQSLIGAAACVLLLLGFILSPSNQITPTTEDDGCVGTYVRIEGTCYSNIELVFSHAAQAISDLDILLAEDHSPQKPNNNNK